MKTPATFAHFEIKRDPVEPEEDSGLSEGQNLHPYLQISKTVKELGGETLELRLLQRQIQWSKDTNIGPNPGKPEHGHQQR